MSKSIQLKDRNNEKYYPHPYYPVGSIYLSVNNTNPSRWFGGTWSLIAQGRTLVGVDTNDTDFNTVQKTGGSKNHTHPAGTLGACYDPKNAYNNVCFKRKTLSNSYSLTGYISESRAVNSGGGSSIEGVAVEGNTGNGSSLQPYFTCYIWCRTA